MVDDMTADIEYNKKLNPSVTVLFLRGKKINISLVFVLQSYLEVLKRVRLYAANYFIVKIPNKREIASNHSSHIDFKDRMKLYKD